MLQLQLVIFYEDIYYFFLDGIMMEFMIRYVNVRNVMIMVSGGSNSS